MGRGVRWTVESVAAAVCPGSVWRRSVGTVSDSLLYAYTVSLGQQSKREWVSGYSRRVKLEPAALLTNVQPTIRSHKLVFHTQLGLLLYARWRLWSWSAAVRSILKVNEASPIINRVHTAANDIIRHLNLILNCIAGPTPWTTLLCLQ